jgi:hypothetical protein
MESLKVHLVNTLPESVTDVSKHFHLPSSAIVNCVFSTSGLFPYLAHTRSCSRKLSALYERVLTKCGIYSTFSVWTLCVKFEQKRFLFNLVTAQMVFAAYVRGLRFCSTNNYYTDARYSAVTDRQLFIRFRPTSERYLQVSQ